LTFIVMRTNFPRAWAPPRITRAAEELSEFFLLKGAQRAVSALSEQQRRSVELCCAGAARRLAVARRLDREDIYVARSLHRDAALWLALAFLAAADRSVDVTSLDAGAVIAGLDPALARAGIVPPAELAMCRDFLRESPLVVDTLGPEDAARSVSNLEVVTHWLSTLVEGRSIRHLRWTRRVRTLAGALVVPAMLIWIAAWLLSPPNVALRKPSRASSTFLGTAPAGALDGKKNGSFGFHSDDEDSPWLSIDLQGLHAISRVEVYGRGDCCYEQSIPLLLAASEDATAYREISRRSDPFSEFDPWVVRTSHLVTRYLRLRKAGHGVLVLSEVEAYGKRKK
jgi:hypothetical protein